MRQAHRNPRARRTSRAKPKEPLAEGIRKRRKKRPNGFFSKMSNDELVSYAKRFMKEKGISGRGELNKTDSGLYCVLLKRKLLDKIGFEKKVRNWRKMSDDELVKSAKGMVDEKGIRSRKELRRESDRLYRALLEKKLLDKVGFEVKKRKERSWKEVTNGEVIDCVKEFMKKNGITGSRELEMEDRGLYMLLIRRGLLGQVGFERKNRSWASMSDDALVKHAKELMEEKKIRKRSTFYKAESVLYRVLRKRGLLEKVGLRSTIRSWASMSDEKLVEYAKKFAEENGINRSSELEKVDNGLYLTLLRRKLIDRIGFVRQRRRWSVMSDDKLVSHAKRLMEEKGISGRVELEKADLGLYKMLCKRKLVDLVFEDIEQAKEREEIQQIVEGLKEFAA